MTVRLNICLSDIDRLAQIAPEMPAAKVAEMLRWIAELQPKPEAVGSFDEPPVAAAAPVIVAPVTDECVAEFVPPAAPAPARTVSEPLSYFEEQRAKIRASKAPAALRAGAWTDAEIREVMALKNRGKTHDEIARELGRTTRSVDNLMHRQRAKTAAKPAPAPVQKSAAPVQPAPVEPALDTPADKPAPSLTGTQRDLMARIMRLDDDFTPQDDLYLVNAVIGRTPTNVIADQLGCDIPTVRARWVALVGFDPTKRPGGMPLETQADLLAVVRAMAEGQAA